MDNSVNPQESISIEGKAISCPRCMAFRWVYIDDRDNGDGVEAEYRCAGCGHIEYVELAD